MTPAYELLDILVPAYEPCAGFRGAACRQARWEPDTGHVPRGFCGAIGNADEVRLVLVCAEPGDPHEGESHASDGTKSGHIRSASEYAWRGFSEGKDRFHRNVRAILNLCWPTADFETQMRRTWITDSVLCSARKEGGTVPVAMGRECARRYLVPQLSLFPQAVVVALGRKAALRLRNAGVEQFIVAAAAAPPGCNRKEACESWGVVARAVHERFGYPNLIEDLHEITGSVATTLAAITSVPPSDGQSFVLTARQLWQGAQVLVESELATPLPGALLVAQALEGALKALLWTTGRVASELSKKPLGHDLEALWSATAQSGFAVSKLPPAWCVGLNALHAPPFHGRYPSGLNGFVTPNAEQAVFEIDKVLALAEGAVKGVPWRKPGA